MDISQLSVRDLLFYGLILNAVIGLILGAVVLSLGFMRGRRNYGIYGLLVCLIGGTIFGVFISIPACIIFAWLIVRKTADPTSPAADGDSI